MILLVPANEIIYLLDKSKFIDRVDVLHHRNLYNNELGNIKKAIKLVTRWLIRNKFTNIAGPVLSGAVLAFAISVESKGKILPTYLSKPKGLYKTCCHDNYNYFEKNCRVAFIDDIIASGDTFKEAEREVRKKGIEFEAIISKFVWSGMFEDKYNGRLYTVVERTKR